MTSAATDRRIPYQPFDPHLIRDFLGQREVLFAALLPAGRNNTNYKLTLTDGETYVLRLYARGSAERDTYVMSLVRDLVPTPVEVYRGDGWSVFSFLDGELLEQAPQHSGVAAAAIARISSIKLRSAGWIGPTGTISPFFFGGVQGFISRKLVDAEVRAWIGPETAGAVVTILRRQAARFDELDAECRLVHGDFNPTNILISREKVSGVLDWELGHSGTPFMDISTLLTNTDERYHDDIEAGLQGGGMRLPDDWKARAGLVALTSQLEALTSARSEAFKRQCAAKVATICRQAQGW